MAAEGGMDVRSWTSNVGGTSKSNGGGCKSDAADFAFGRLGGRAAVKQGEGRGWAAQCAVHPTP